MPRPRALFFLLLLLPSLAPADQIVLDPTAQRIQDALNQLNGQGTTAAAVAARAAACDNLAAMGKPAQSVLWALHLAALNDPSPDVRERASLAVVALGGGRELKADVERRFAQIVAGIDFTKPFLPQPGKPAAAAQHAKPLDTDFPTLPAEPFDPWVWDMLYAFPTTVTTRAPQLARAALDEIGSTLAAIPATLVDAVQSNITALDGSAADRLAAARRLGCYRPIAGPALPALRRALKDEQPAVRDAAARAINTPDAARVAARGRWADALSDPSPTARLAAALALLHDEFAPPDVMDPIVIAMAQPDPLARQGLADAVRAAWQNDTAVAAALTRAAAAARDPIDRQINAAARKMLANAAHVDDRALAPERRAITEELTKRLAGKNSDVARAALRHLLDSVPPADLVGPLARAARADDPELRHDATQALMSAGDPGVAALAALLKDPRAPVKGLALVQLGRLGPAAATAARDIAATLADPDPALRRMAADALGALGPTAAAPALEPLAAARKDKDPDVVTAALAAGARLKPGDPRFARRALNGPTAEEITGLSEQLRDKDHDARREAAAYIAGRHLVPPPVAAALTRAVEQGDFTVREGLTLAIAQAWADNTEVIAALRIMLEHETDPARRTYLKAALRAITPVD